MKCPICRSVNTEVIDKRNLSKINGIYRRLRCLDCTFRFSTYETLSRKETNDQ